MDSRQKLVFKRHFTADGQDVYDTVKWKVVDAVITNSKGQEKFRQNGVEVPEPYSENATNIVAEKYFRVVNETKETSVRQVAHRIASTIMGEGVKQGLLDPETAHIFYDELVYLIIHQMMAFNSPVWFNIGVPGVKQQASACFIQHVADTMEDITSLIGKEMMLFKSGSGTGSNLSTLRSSWETLSGGGLASGPVSFMEPLDAAAGATKSGGTTRRAAKMQILNFDHPDILSQKSGRPGFITCKSAAEKLAHDLYETGKYGAEFNDPNNVYEKVGFQNANNSVRVTDEFMELALNGGSYFTKAVTTGEPIEELAAGAVLDAISEAAWYCGDPGMQYDTTINRWHTVPDSGRIHGSNPCSEYMYLDDSACNLASLNLVRFDVDGEFAINDFRHACEVTITAMEILVGYSEYPSPEIAANSHKFRPLGLGYANLGALLMLYGLPYDSYEGRNLAGAITSLLSGAAYAQSARMAASVGAFEGLAEGNNAEHMLRVIGMHQEAAVNLWDRTQMGTEADRIAHAGHTAWCEALSLGESHGFRNGQISVMAPTGTISFMMDCDTTGIEPAPALVTYKKLVGGGNQVLFCRSVDKALENLGYNKTQRQEMAAHIDATGDIVGAPHLKPEHGAIFQTAFGKNPLSVDGHLEMMAAIQPFVSGAISKTVNLPKTATVEDFKRAYVKAWQLGLKAVALFRDGCKLSQPIATKQTDTSSKKDDASVLDGAIHGSVEPAAKVKLWGDRNRLPDERESLTHKFSIAGQDGYITVGFDPDGRVMEFFVRIAKAGSTLGGLVETFATMASMALQHGAPLESIIDKLKGTSFEPSGFTRNQEIHSVTSICDYIGRYLEKLVEKRSNREPSFPSWNSPMEQMAVVEAAVEQAQGKRDSSGPPCSSCGNMTRRAGSCYVCSSCGTTTGCG